MAALDKTTSMNGGIAFHTTHWTQIVNASSSDEPVRKAALEELLGRYWRPVYYYLRCKGYGSEETKDLSQSFFQDVVLGHGLIQRADRTKGRFRTFLLTALDRYVASVHRAEKAIHRTPEGGLMHLADIDDLRMVGPAHSAAPAEAFDYAWASALLDEVLGEVEQECHEKGRATHWQMFRARIIQPVLDGAESPTLAQLCETHGIPSVVKVSKMTMLVRRRFRALLRQHVRQFVDSDADVDDEIRYLMRILARETEKS